MDDIGVSKFEWLDFDEKGSLKNADASDRLAKALRERDATDLVVMSHGWKNDHAAAMRIYKPLWANTRSALATLDPARIVVVGVQWPAQQYRTNFDEDALTQAMAEGALSANGGQAEDLDQDGFDAAIADFIEAAGADARDLTDLAHNASLDISKNDARRLVRSALLAAEIGESDSEAALDGSGLLTRAQDDPSGLLRDLSSRPPVSFAAGSGEAKGVGDDIARIFQGPRASVARFLNQLTYYKMKERAGLVGARLGGELLAQLSLEHPTRLHLIGHSFGARLVTSAANSLPSLDRLPLTSLTLLQGAFSHHGLMADYGGVSGAFAGVVGRVSGPIAITHTHNDKACAVAYAWASRVAQDVAKSVGGPDDPFGAMGANGARNADAINHPDFPPVEGTAPVRGKINNYRADRYIVGVPPGKDAHGDVFNEHVGRLVAAVLEA